MIISSITLLTGCKKAAFNIPEDERFLVKIDKVRGYYDAMDKQMAKNIFMPDDNIYTISKYRMKSIRKEGGILFGEIDLSAPAKDQFVYWYSHEKLTKISGFSIHGLKYK